MLTLMSRVTDPYHIHGNLDPNSNFDLDGNGRLAYGSVRMFYFIGIFFQQELAGI